MKCFFHMKNETLRRPLFKKLAIPVSFSLFFRFFNTVDSKGMFYINFANDWIRTADFRCWKPPLYQLNHNLCYEGLFLSSGFYKHITKNFTYLSRRQRDSNFEIMWRVVAAELVEGFEPEPGQLWGLDVTIMPLPLKQEANWLDECRNVDQGRKLLYLQMMYT